MPILPVGVLKPGIQLPGVVRTADSKPGPGQLYGCHTVDVPDLRCEGCFYYK